MQTRTPRAFDVHERVPPSVLRRAQALVDLLAHPPPRPSKRDAVVHPLRRVIDVVTSAHAKAEPGSGTGRGFVLRALRDGVGMAEGGALYRHWVHEPRRFLDAVANELAHCVQSDVLPVLLPHTPTPSCDSAPSTDALDVHVQFYPSVLGSSSVAPCVAPTLRAVMPHTAADRHGFCAAVVVRRRCELRRRAEEQAELHARFMAAAAEGQTLQSALDFWSAVSYGEGVDALTAQFQPLGLTQTRPRDDDDDDDDVPRRRRRRERAGLDTSDDEQEPSDTVSEAAKARLALRAERPPAILLGDDATGDGVGFCQPSVLLTRGGGRDTTTSRDKGGVLRQGRCGLVAVLYVSVHGIAYVGYPATLPRVVSDTTVCAVAATVLGSCDTKLPVSPRAASRAVAWVLPLDTNLSFTRGLLGLS